MQRSFGLSLPVFQHCRDDSKHYEIAVAAKHTQAVAGKGVPQTCGVVLGLGGQLDASLYGSIRHWIALRRLLQEAKSWAIAFEGQVSLEHVIIFERPWTKEAMFTHCK